MFGCYFFVFGMSNVGNVDNEYTRLMYCEALAIIRLSDERPKVLGINYFEVHYTVWRLRHRRTL